MFYLLVRKLVSHLGPASRRSPLPGLTPWASLCRAYGAGVRQAEAYAPETHFRWEPFSSTGIPACAPSCSGLVCAKRGSKRPRSLILQVWHGQSVFLRWHRQECLCYLKSKSPDAWASGLFVCFVILRSRFALRIESWCGRVDSNHHGIATASPSSWCVCQFRHDRSC